MAVSEFYILKKNDWFKWYKIQGAVTR